MSCYQSPDPTKQSTSDKSVMITSSQVDTRCGVGVCKPIWLQKLCTVQGFVGFNAVSNLFTFSLRMLIMSQVTTIEKRFGFNSSQSGFILSSSQITFLIFILFFSHFGRDSHIPRILSVTSVIAGLTGLMFATAHFLPVQNSLKEDNSGHNITSDVCHGDGIFNSSRTDNCQGETNQSDLSKSAMAIFVVAMLIQGVATSPRTPLGGTYIDDNNPIPTKTGKYMGVMMGILILAPVMAFGMGALSSEVYHTLEKPPHLSPGDPRWIGAWWLGFLVLGLMAMLTSTFIFFFPKRMSIPVVTSAIQDNGQKSNEVHGEVAQKQPDKEAMKPRETTKRIIQHIKGPFLGIVRVLRNPVFTATIMVGTLQSFAMLGMATFLPKYLEVQFYVPAVTTNIMLGAISILGNTLGPICGGIVTSRYKLSTLNNLRLVFAVCILLTIGAPIGMFIAGKQTNIVKPNLPGYTGHAAVVNSSNCVADCYCPDASLLPVCGSDGVTYYSPCHAGCHGQDNGTYTKCTCATGTAARGFCAEEDPIVYILLVYFTLTTFFLTFPMSPSFMIIVRSVSEKDKALALGLSSFVSTLLGHFPGPIVYGKLVDTTCILWQDSCSGRGACALYDIAGLRNKIFGTNLGLFCLSTLFILFAMLYHGRVLRMKEKQRNYEMANGDSDPAVLNKIEGNET